MTTSLEQITKKALDLLDPNQSYDYLLSVDRAAEEIRKSLDQQIEASVHQRRKNAKITHDPVKRSR